MTTVDCPEVDNQLVPRIRNFLRDRGVPEIDKVQLEDQGGGVVVLRGQLTSPRAEWLCINCCRRVAGVRRVIDELLVDGEDHEESNGQDVNSSKAQSVAIG